MGEGEIKNRIYKLLYITNPLWHPELWIAQQHFPSKDILISPNFPARKTWPEEQIFWGTDPLGAPDLNFVQESKKRTECPRGRVRVLSWQGENNSYKFFHSVLPAELMNTSWKSAFDFCSGGKLSLATDWTKTTISFCYRRNTKVLETNPFIWTLWTVYTLISYA